MHSDIESPFFIIGCPRSGTTLLQLLLDTHKNICIPPESFIFTNFIPLLDVYGNFENTDTFRLFVKHLITDYRIRRWKLDISIDDFMHNVHNRSMQGALSFLFSEYARRNGAKRWGDKTPQHAFEILNIHSVFPNAKFIHLIRDGRDVAESYLRIFIGPNTVYEAARRWCKYINSIDDTINMIGNEFILNVYYENLVRDTTSEINRILNFIGEKTLNEPLHFDENPHAKYYLELAPIFSSLKNPISDEKIGMYKKTFTHYQIAIFESIAAHALKRHGYKLTIKEHLKIGKIEKFAYIISDHVLRYFKKLFVTGGIYQIRRELLILFQKNFRKASIFLHNVGR